MSFKRWQKLMANSTAKVVACTEVAAYAVVLVAGFTDSALDFDAGRTLARPIGIFFSGKAPAGQAADQPNHRCQSSAFAATRIAPRPEHQFRTFTFTQPRTIEVRPHARLPHVRLLEMPGLLLLLPRHRLDAARPPQAGETFRPRLQKGEGEVHGEK